MKSTILFNVSGTSTTDSGEVISNMEISVKVHYDPILLLSEVADNLPKVMAAFDKLVKTFEEASANDNTPTGTAQQPFEAAHASTDGTFDEEEWLNDVVIPDAPPMAEIIEEIIEEPISLDDCEVKLVVNDKAGADEFELKVEPRN
jgi:hypothetical protein